MQFVFAEEVNDDTSTMEVQLERAPPVNMVYVEATWVVRIKTIKNICNSYSIPAVKRCTKHSSLKIEKDREQTVIEHVATLYSIL